MNSNFLNRQRADVFDNQIHISLIPKVDLLQHKGDILQIIRTQLGDEIPSRRTPGVTYRKDEK